MWYAIALALHTFTIGVYAFPLLPTETYESKFDVVESMGNTTRRFYAEDGRYAVAERVVTVLRRPTADGTTIVTYKTQFSEGNVGVVEVVDGQCVSVLGSGPADYNLFFTLQQFPSSGITRVGDGFSRGQPVEVYEYRGGVQQSITSRTDTYGTVRWYVTTMDWQNNDFNQPQLVRVEALGNTTLLNGVTLPLQLNIYVALFEMGTIDNGLALSPCDGGAAPLPEVVPISVVPYRPLPPLPSSFSATIVTTMMSTKTSFTSTVRLDVDKGWFSLQEQEPFQDAVGRHFVSTTYALGSTQSVYHETRREANDDADAVISALRSYFLPNERICIRAAFSSEVIERDMKRIFLVTSPPLYYGACVIRGTDCEWWSLQTSSYAAQWYFALPDDQGERMLLRMIVRGWGTSPFFVHHPFLVNAQPVSANVSDACAYFNREGDAQCFPTSDGVSYFNVYDFWGTSYAAEDATVAVPSYCTLASQTFNFPAQNCAVDSTRTTALIALLIGAAMITTFALTTLWVARHA